MTLCANTCFEFIIVFLLVTIPSKYLIKIKALLWLPIPILTPFLCVTNYAVTQNMLSLHYYSTPRLADPKRNIESKIIYRSLFKYPTLST